jgi:transposase InsO family protein
MPWQEQSTMSLKAEFVERAMQPDVNRSQVCRQYGISRTTAYQLLARYAAEGAAGLASRSRRPRTSPQRTDAAIEAEVVAVRDAHPCWGGRKLAKVLETRGVAHVPAASTCTDILRRHDRLAPPATQPHPWQRFEHAAANDLWQLDFKGHVPMAVGRCHPLSVVDDHSRFLVGLTACANEQDATVRAILSVLFRRYGMPWHLLVDNGPPWGNPHPLQRETRLSYWLLRLGIRVIHGRPLHPQTQGKVERFHRTLIGEVLATTPLPDLVTAQCVFDAWRDVYNQERPHDALELATPLSRYQVAQPREFPESLPPIDYGPGAIVTTVHGTGQLTYHGLCFYVSAALVREPVALRPTSVDGVFDLFYCHRRLGQLNAHTKTYHHAHAEEDPTQHVTEQTV